MKPITALLRSGKSVLIRYIASDDANSLFTFLQSLSAASRSRFGPHPYDYNAAKDVCEGINPGLRAFVAIDPPTGSIVAYMLILDGLLPEDDQRYQQRGIILPPHRSATYAPSVADDWQSMGLASAMYPVIEQVLKANGKNYIVLWGGVQATNQKAIGFYEQQGFVPVGSFYLNEMNNNDMMKEL